MLEPFDLQKLAREVFARQLPGVELENLSAEPVSGGNGEDMVRITLLFEPAAFEAIDGSEALKLLREMNDALQREGEDRIASIEYATTDDVPVDED